jgi:hypothetical protein
VLKEGIYASVSEKRANLFLLLTSPVFPPPLFTTLLDKVPLNSKNRSCTKENYFVYLYYELYIRKVKMLTR